jgi:hypothetical protein
LAVLPLDRLFSIADLLSFEVGVLVPSFLDNCLLPFYLTRQAFYVLALGFTFLNANWAAIRKGNS